MFNINQIVKGTNAGTFVILGFRTVGETYGAQLKEVDPNDYSKTATGEMFLPLDAIQTVDA